MVESNTFSDRVYIVTLRIIQPARVQDVYAALEDIFGEIIHDKVTKEEIYNSHAAMKKSGLLIGVRKGTYCLDHRAWVMARKLTKFFKLDNKRFFLMKQERKRYTQ